MKRLFKSLLSAFTFLALAGFRHVAAGDHTTVMCLEEVGRLVKGVSLLPLLCFLLVHDSFEIVTLPALLHTFFPLFLELLKLILSICAISQGFVLLLGLVGHVNIVGGEGFRVLFVSTIVLSHKLLLVGSVHLLHLSQLSIERVDFSLQRDHLGSMALLVAFLDLLSVSGQLVLLGVFLSSEITFCRFKVLDLLDSSFLMLFGVLLEFLELVPLVVKSLGEVLDSLA